MLPVFVLFWLLGAALTVAVMVATELRARRSAARQHRSAIPSSHRGYQVGRHSAFPVDGLPPPAR
jgi:hypothetical protein